MKERLDVHAVYVSEGEFDVEAEGKRLKAIMDKFGNVNIFISEVRCLLNSRLKSILNSPQFNVIPN